MQKRKYTWGASYQGILIIVVLACLGPSALRAGPKKRAIELSIYGSFLQSGALRGGTDFFPLYQEQETRNAYNSAVDGALSFPANLFLREEEVIPELFQTERRAYWQSVYPSPLNYPLLLEEVDTQAEIDNVRGEATGLQASTGGISFMYPLEFKRKHLHVEQTLDYRRTRIAFERTAFLSEPGRAHFDLEDVSYGVSFTQFLNPRRFWFTGLRANLGREYGASPKDAFFPEGELGVGFVLGQNLELGLGLSYSFLGGQGDVFPLLMLNWTLGGHWEVEVLFPEYARIKYHFSASASLGAGVSADGGSYRMIDERNELNWSLVQAEIIFEFFPRDNLRLEFKPGYIFSQEYTFFRDGVQVQKYEGDKGGVVSFVGTLLF